MIEIAVNTESAAAESSLKEGKRDGESKVEEGSAPWLQRLVTDERNLKILAIVAFVLLMHIWAVLASIHDFEKAQSFLALIGACWIVALSRLLASHMDPLVRKSTILTSRLHVKEAKESRWTPV
ncbi:hypothetical protein COOONC_06811 [Cooperia oncophora]